MPRKRVIFIHQNHEIRTRTAQALVSTGHQIFSFELAQDALNVMAFADVIIAEGTRRPMDDVDFLLRVRTLTPSPVVLCSPYSVEFVRTYGDMIGGLLTALEAAELVPMVTDVITSMTPAEPAAEVLENASNAAPIPAFDAVPRPKRQFFAGFAVPRWIWTDAVPLVEKAGSLA